MASAKNEEEVQKQTVQSAEVLSEERTKENEELARRAVSPLDEILPEDQKKKMREALDNFLLADPERQILQLGSVDSLISKGDSEKTQGRELVARGDYETAAKIEIYRQDKEGARKCLKLAQGVARQEDDRHAEFHRTLLSNMDEALRVAGEYYATLGEQREKLREEKSVEKSEGKEGEDDKFVSVSGAETEKDSAVLLRR